MTSGYGVVDFPDKAAPRDAGALITIRDWPFFWLVSWPVSGQVTKPVITRSQGSPYTPTLDLDRASALLHLACAWKSPANRQVHEDAGKE